MQLNLRKFKHEVMNYTIYISSKHKINQHEVISRVSITWKVQREDNKGKLLT